MEKGKKETGILRTRRQVALERGAQGSRPRLFLGGGSREDDSLGERYKDKRDYGRAIFLLLTP